MKIFTFEKSYLERIDEFSVVLEDENASSIENQWRDFLESTLEPAGYKCIWKINRSICEKLTIPYGSEVYGEVLNTDFEDLTVELRIEGVKDENIELPERVRVPLSSIYPTVMQENAVNADFTADILDRYRFFYNYVFLPFDQGGLEKNWAKNNLIPRVQFFFDLNNSATISKAMASHIRQLLEEAKYIKDKREIFETTDDDLDLSKNDSKETAVKLLELHLRMNQIKSEIELMTNPEMREVYEALKFPSTDVIMGEKKVYVVNKEGTINDQIQLLEKLKSKVETHDKIHWVQSLNNAFERAGNSSQIFIPSATYSLKFMEYLNDSLSLCGLNEIPEKFENIDKMNSFAVIRACDLSSMLFAIKGDMKFANLIFDCRNVNTAFLIKSGNVSFENCFIIGSSMSGVSEAFNLSGNSTLQLKCCFIKCFGTAMNATDSKVKLINTSIKECATGIAIDNENTLISMEDSNIFSCKDYPIVKFMRNIEDGQKLILNVMDDKMELEKLNIMMTASDIQGEDGHVKLISKLSEDFQLTQMESE